MASKLKNLTLGPQELVLHALPVHDGQLQCVYCKAEFGEFKTWCCYDRVEALRLQGLDEDTLGEFRLWEGLFAQRARD